MSKGKKILNVITYTFLGMVLFYQIMGLFSIIGGPAILGASMPTKLREARGFIPSWILMTLLVSGAVVLCKVWKKKEKASLIPMVMGLVGAVLALLVALTLRAALPLQIANSNVSYNGLQGLSNWKLFWRHLTPIGVGVVTAVISFMHFKAARDQRIHIQNETYTEAFNLDAENPLLEVTVPTGKKLSKKQRKEQKEKENGGN